MYRQVAHHNSELLRGQTNLFELLLKCAAGNRAVFVAVPVQSNCYFLPVLAQEFVDLFGEDLLPFEW